MLPIRRALRAAFAAASLVLVSAVSFAQANHLVISQVYGGGGNSGSVFTYDFVELYNPTSAPVDLSTYSLQYASAASTSAPSGTLVLQGAIQPGKYFLVQLAAGAASTGALPTPDFAPGSNAFNMSGTTGKVILVNGTTTLTTSCPTAAQATDFVGWGPATGTTANCSYGDSTGANRAPATTNSTGLALNSSNSWTGVNKTDYTVVTPNPRNSVFGGTAATALSITSTAFTPTAIMQGMATTLAVVVSPGTSTSNIAVAADLSSIGGSATQALALTSANTYSSSVSVSGATAPGTYPITVRVTSSDPAVTGSANLTVNAATVTTPISTIQANRAIYVGTQVQFQGVVTVVTNAGYYLQTPSSSPGSTGDEGIYVYAGSGKVPTTIAVGNLVTINGTLTLFPAATASHTPSLEVTSASVTSNGTAAIPAPVVLPANFPTAGGGIYQLTKYEGMLVRFPSLTSTSPTDGFLTETTETVTSTGQFYAVTTGTARPFREPGMDFRDYPTATCPSLTACTATATSAGVARPANLVLFDDNPERIIVESSLGGGTVLDLSTGAVLTNATGVIDFSYATDVPYGDPARLILQAKGGTGTVTPGVTVQALALPSSSQVTIAAFNIERFFNPTAADNKYFNAGSGNVGNSSAVNVTADAYARRLKKLSLAVRTVLNTPDVLAVEEVENKSVLQDIAAQISADSKAAGATDPGYVAYGTDSTTTYTDDVGGISVGFLVKPSSTNVTRWEQIGAASTFTASTGTQTLNDRPSQVLHVGFKRAGGAPDYPMTLVVNHLRSLSGISTSADTRLKKELQAEAIATAIQGYQAAGERVLAMGDLNAFEFSDGYTDTLGTFTGNVSPVGTAAQPGKAIVNPVATNLATLLPLAERRSYVEFGNAQVLDHVVATSNVVANTQLAYAHLDADFPNILTNDATSPARVSDHDAAVTYLTVPAPVVRGTLTGNGTFPITNVGSSSAGQQFIFSNTGEAPIPITSVAIGSPTTTSDFTQSNNCGTALAVGGICQINVVFKPTAGGTRTGTLTVLGGALFNPITLTGTGLVPATFTFTSNGSGSASVTVQRGFAAQVPLTLTPTSTFAGTVTLSCTNLPSNTSCDFGSAATLNLAAGSSAQSITLLLRTSTLNSSVQKAQVLTGHDGTRLALAFCLPGLLLAGLGARSRRLYGSRLVLFGICLLTLAGALGLTGCSSHTVPNTTSTTFAAAGTYTINVVATGANVTQTVPVTLTIQ